MSLRPLCEKEFVQFQQLISREAGIFLPPGKMALLSARLGRHIRELGLHDFGSYFKLVIDRGDEELIRLLDRICTNETRFFREPRQFEFLERQYFRQRRSRHPKQLRIWSAACSTGEEPYSVAMCVARNFPAAEGWRSEIIASDLSTRALSAATAGVWPIEQSAEIPAEYLKDFMLRGVRREAGRMRASDQIRSMIDFRRINLHSNHYAIEGTFDVILCRNVLIYFDADGKAAVVNRLLQRLAPGGVLLLGQSESLAGWSAEVRSVGPSAYLRHE